LQLSLFLLLKNPEVQTLVSRLAAAYLSEKSGTDIIIGEIYVSLTGQARLKDFAVNDFRGETMIKVKDFFFEPASLKRKDRTIVVKNLELTGVDVALRKASQDDLSNLAHFLQHFEKKDTNTANHRRPITQPWTFVCKNISIRNGSFIYVNEDSVTEQKSINFSDIHLTDLDLLAKNLKIEKDTISARFQNLTLVEKSGFELKEFSGLLMFSPVGLKAGNMIVTTNNSNLDFDLRFLYDDLSAYSDFINEVDFDLDLRPSELEMSDIGFFAETMFGMTNFLELHGKFTGKVTNIYGKNFGVKYGENTTFNGDVRMNGLPYFNTTFIHADIKKLQTKATDVGAFTLPGNMEQIPVPDLLTKMEVVNIQGKFTGFPNDFVSRATIESKLGSIKTDLVLKSLEPDGQPSYKGSILATSLEAGTLFSAKPMLGRTTFYLNVNGTGFNPDSMDISAKGVIHSLVFNGYNYRKIKLDGNLKNRVFEGYTKISDQNLDFVFDGLIDFNEEKPRFDFTSNIENADLFALKFNKNDSLSILSAHAQFDFYASGFDDVIGGISFDSVKYTDSSGEYFMNFLELNSFKIDNGKSVFTLNSDFLDINIEGNYTNSKVVPSIKKYVRNYSGVLASAINTPTDGGGKDQLSVSIRLKNTDELTRFLAPDLGISPGSEINGYFDFVNDSVLIHATGSIDYGSLYFDKWFLSTISDKNSFSIITGADQLLLSGENTEKDNNFGADSLRIFARFRNDSTLFNLSWNDLSNLNQNTGELNGFVHLEATNRLSAGFTDVSIKIDSILWKVSEKNKIAGISGGLFFSDLAFYSDSSQFNISGGISRNSEDSLKLIFDQVNISELDQLINSRKLDIDGILNGKLTLMSLYENPNLIADISVDDFIFNQGKLGNLNLKTQWADSLQKLMVDMALQKAGNLGVSDIITIIGDYYPASSDQNFDLNIKLNNLGTHIFNPFIEGYASLDRASLASGELHFTGSYAKPLATGNINLMRTQFLIDYLNTKYTAVGSVEIVENAINVKNLDLFDIQQNQAACSGRITHEYFRDFNLDILVSIENFSALNTTSRDNELFYGDAIASGNVLISGPFDNVKMNINARTENGTRIVVPISSALSVSENDFIVFINNTDTIAKEPESYNLNVKGFTMDMEVSVTPEAAIEIYLPYNMGNIKGNGIGEIGLGINPRGDFSINGDYAISGGTFFFNFENLIGREFKIQEGSRISWSGDPYDAVVDIMATYKVKTTLAGLRLQTDSTAVRNTRVEVDCNINLRNELFNPDIRFSIDFANVTEDTKQIIFAALDTTDQSAMSQQIISLLVIGSFSYTTGGPSLGVTGFKLLSNQLSEWLSRISNDLDVGINYQPGTELSEEELEVVLRTQLFNDRLSIDGNFGVRGNAKEQNTSNVVGDINVEYKITEDGRFRVKAFNRTNEISFLEDNAPYTQGIGVFFRKEFERFRDLFRRDKNKQRDKNRNLRQNREQHAIKPEEINVVD
jgi:hypothetical protein